MYIKPLFKVICLFFLLLLILSFPVYAAYINRYSAITQGGMTYTGNTLGLSKGNGNGPGTNGSIGAFITTDTTLHDGSYPDGTTSDWNGNSSNAQLTIPAGSAILYAELIWGGSYKYAGHDVSAYLDNSIKFTTPNGVYNISPAPSTAVTLTSEYYYVRSADVSAYVISAGAGAYSAGSVPATESTTEDNANAAGWTLAVIYKNPSMPTRSMSIFVGGEMTNSANSPTSSVTGFCTAQSGSINARMMLSVIEGDSNISGDQMKFGPAVASLSAVSGPNNPVNNFFCSQINNDNGILDTAGSFGTSNHTPGSNGSGKRQGWDITNVDVSSFMQNSQSTAYARGTTTGDRYIINSVGIQIDVGAPSFASNTLTVDKNQTYQGDILTYTVVLDNTAGTAAALNTIFYSNPANGTSFINGSVTVNGVSQSSLNPSTGILAGTIEAGTSATVTFQIKVDSIPSSPASAIYSSDSRIEYQYQSCPGSSITGDTVTMVPVNTQTARIEISKTSNAVSPVKTGDVITYTIRTANTGAASADSVAFVDSIPAGTSYIANSTFLNGNLVSDVSGEMPFKNGGLINSVTAPSGKIDIGESATVTFNVSVNSIFPPAITNTASVDPDSADSAPSVQAFISNDTFTVDLSVLISDGQTSVSAGASISYIVTVTNNSAYTVTDCALNTVLPSSILNPIFTPSTGTYTNSSGQWTSFMMNASESITLVISGLVDAKASGTLLVSAVVNAPAGSYEPVSSNNTSSDTDTSINSAADISVSKTNGLNIVKPGADLTYAITIRNEGPSTIQKIILSEALPPKLQNPVFIPSVGSYDTNTGEWSGLNLEAGKSVDMLLKATLVSNATGTLVNSATVSFASGTTDPDITNNTAQDSDTIAALVMLVKSVDKTNANPGDELIYSVYYRNIGASTANNVIITDSIPTNTDYITDSLKIGDVSSNYDTAIPKTDVDGDDEAYIDQLTKTVKFKINSIPADDGIINSGNDEGKVYYKVKIK